MVYPCNYEETQPHTHTHTYAHAHTHTHTHSLDRKGRVRKEPRNTGFKRATTVRGMTSKLTVFIQLWERNAPPGLLCGHSAATCITINTWRHFNHHHQHMASLHPSPATHGITSTITIVTWCHFSHHQHASPSSHGVTSTITIITWRHFNHHRHHTASCPPSPSSHGVMSTITTWRHVHHHHHHMVSCPPSPSSHGVMSTITTTQRTTRLTCFTSQHYLHHAKISANT